MVEVLHTATKGIAPRIPVWPAIRSSKYNLDRPSVAKAMEGILRSQPTKVGSERRMEGRCVSLNTYARK